MGNSRIILPLDHTPWPLAQQIMEQTAGRVWGYKVRRSVLEAGLGILKQIKLFGNVMLDFKLYDIPSAMTESLNLHREAGANITTVHCSSGYDPMAEGMEKTGIAGVTVLTSMDRQDVRRYYRADGPEELVRRMAADASERYEFLVCSARDLADIRQLPIQKICPGIRPHWYLEPDDQTRVATPAEAVQMGADLLVIGRPILGAADIAAAVDRTNEEIEAALARFAR